MRFAALVLLLVSGTAAAQPSFGLEPRKPTPFDQGRKHFYFGLGAQTSDGDHYWAAGLGFGYFLVDGLEASLHGTYYWGDGPTIIRLSPELRYVVQPLLPYSPVVPYIGASASEYFVDDPDLNTNAVGAHGGIVYVQRYVVIGFGVGVEHFLGDCRRNCTWAYPELTISVPF